LQGGPQRPSQDFETLSTHPRVFSFPNLFSPTDAAALLHLVKDRFQTSKVGVGDGVVNNVRRSSETSFREAAHFGSTVAHFQKLASDVYGARFATEVSARGVTLSFTPLLRL
jgi:hypothetical protein